MRGAATAITKAAGSDRNPAHTHLPFSDSISLYLSLSELDKMVKTIQFGTMGNGLWEIGIWEMGFVWSFAFWSFSLGNDAEMVIF